jgi:hypothetical protein
MNVAGRKPRRQIGGRRVRLAAYTRHNRSQTGEHNREGWTMDVQREAISATRRLAEMSLEELLYYVLVGRGRLVKEPQRT